MDELLKDKVNAIIMKLLGVIGVMNIAMYSEVCGKILQTLIYQ